MVPRPTFGAHSVPYKSFQGKHDLCVFTSKLCAAKPESHKTRNASSLCQLRGCNGFNGFNRMRQQLAFYPTLSQFARYRKAFFLYRVSSNSKLASDHYVMP